ncbi:MAG TPA: hypothetical protein V6C72_16275 [Chroococcales cyanobacterium]
MSATKKVCPTCGFDISTLKSAADDSAPAGKAPKTMFWSKFLPQADRGKDSGAEKPALS